MRLAFETGDSSKIDAGAILQTGQWGHLAVVINGVKASLYLNGKEVAENSNFQFVPILISNMTSNMLGKSNYTADSYFKGGMDDFRIYNRALSASEITMLSNGEEPIREIQTVTVPEDVETVVGEKPALPEKADVTYKDGTNGKESIIWEDVPEEKYAQAGVFTVKGTVGAFEVEITVNVKEKDPVDPEVTLDKITVKAPKKVEYKKGESLDLTGMEVTAYYSDGKEEVLPEGSYTVAGYDANKVGKQTITVTYKDQTATFDVTVKEASKPVEPGKPDGGDQGQKPGTPDNKPAGQDKKPNKVPKTGDAADMTVYVFGMMAALVAGGWMLKSRRKEQE